MDVYVAKPWEKETGLKRYRDAFIVMLFLMSFIASYALLLNAPKALAVDGDVGKKCSSFVIAGDVNGVGITGNRTGRIKEKLARKGVEDVEYLVGNGRRVEEVADAIRGANIKGKCLIVEAGAGNVLDEDSEQNVKEIESLRDAIKEGEALRTYWVTPVFSDKRDPSLKGNPKEFNNDLSRVLGKEDDIRIINIQNFSLQDSLFEKSKREDGSPALNDRMMMTSSGYDRRANLIVEEIEKDIEEEKEEETPTPSPSPSPSSAPAVPPINNGSGGNTGGGGPGPGGSPGGGAPTQPTPGGPKGFNPSQFSPAAFANRLKTTTSLSEANRYLIIGRWASPTIPTSDFDPLNKSFFRNGGARFTMGIFSAAYFIMLLFFWVTSFALMGDIASLALRVGDYFYGQYFGFSSGGENATSFMLASSILTIAFMLAGWRAISPSNRGGFNQRMQNFYASMLKTATVVGLAIASGTMSKANGQESDVQAIEQTIRDNGFFSNNEKEDAATMDQMIKNSSQNHARVDPSVSRNINAPLTWKPLSLGFIVSFIYEAGRVFAAAVLAIITAPVSGPIEAFNNALSGNSNTAADEVGQFGPGVSKATTCDRYVDAMHVAYLNAGTSTRNPASAKALRAFDLVYYGALFPIVEHAHGGGTASGSRSWCWEMESNVESPAGDRAMLARGAGAYGAAFGTGDVITGQSVMASGKHSTLSPVADRIPTESGTSGGLLVDANGEWTMGKTEADRMGGVRRAEAFLGYDRGEHGLNAARFYHAACMFKPGSTQDPILSEEWNSVIAMTWDLKKKNNVNLSKDEQNKANDAQEGAQDKERSSDKGKQQTKEFNNLVDSNKFLTDDDCVIPMLASNITIQEPDPDINPAGYYGGFGSLNEKNQEEPYSARWGFADPSGSALTNMMKKVMKGANDALIQSIKSNVPGGGIIFGDGDKKDDDDEDPTGSDEVGSGGIATNDGDSDSGKTVAEKSEEKVNGWGEKARDSKAGQLAGDLANWAGFDVETKKNPKGNVYDKDGNRIEKTPEQKQQEKEKKRQEQEQEGQGATSSSGSSTATDKESGSGKKNDGEKKYPAASKFTLNKAAVKGYTDENVDTEKVQDGAYQFYIASNNLKADAYPVMVFVSLFICVGFCIMSIPVVLLGVILTILSLFVFLFITVVVGFALLKYAAYGGSRRLE